jgi:hypothetical protein
MVAPDIPAVVVLSETCPVSEKVVGVGVGGETGVGDDQLPPQPVATATLITISQVLSIGAFGQNVSP